MRADLVNRVECECHEAHSVTKLGHCATCPYYKFHVDQNVDQVQLHKRCSAIENARKRRKPAQTLRVCRSEHADGTAHDFNWATYRDDRQEYGVCACGMTSMDHAIWTGA